MLRRPYPKARHHARVELLMCRERTTGPPWHASPMRAWQRFGGAAAIVGGVLAAAFNLLHSGPRRGNTRLFLEDLVGSRVWEADQLGIAVSLMVVAVALVAISRVLGAGEAAPWAAAAGAVALAGVAVALANVAVDGPAMQEVADRWAAAESGRRESLFAAAEVLRSVDIALFSVWTLVLVGGAPILYGVAILVGGGLSRWLGWLAIAGGALGLVTGAVQMFVGLKPVTVFVLFPAASTALIAWLVLVGIVFWRRGGASGGPIS